MPFGGPRTTAERLTRFGYFPKEIPPYYSTATLADSWPVLSSFNFNDRKTTKSCRYYIPKTNNSTRTLSLPNPYSQIQLSMALEVEWTQIQSHINTSPYSKSRPKVDMTHRRALVPYILHADFLTLRATFAPEFRYLVYSDISSYYGNIYTHSIPWALHSKTQAKQYRDDRLFGNRLDRLIRNCMDGQTKGIPIGPDTSLVISEILAAAMDVELAQRLSKIIHKGFRYIDDYCIYCSNESDARYIQSALEAIFRQFELEPNSTKTRLVDLPETYEESWVSNLRHLPIRRSELQQKSDLLSFFNAAFDSFRQHKNIFVLKYALGRLCNTPVHEGNWDIFESLLIRTAISDPYTLPVVSEILCAYENQGYELDTEKIQGAITQIIITHAQHSVNFEVDWALWIANALAIEIPEAAALMLGDIDDPFIALSSLNLRDRKLINSGLSTSSWETNLIGDELYGENWLMCYEAITKGWLTASTNIVTNDSFFDTLQKNGVSFFDPNARQDTSQVMTDVEDEDLESMQGATANRGFGY